MATIGDLSGDEREQRAAELKRKMQEAARRARAARGEETIPAPAAAEPTPPPAAVEPAAVDRAVAHSDVETATLEAVAVAEQPAVDRAALAPPVEATRSNGQGAAAGAQSLPAPAPVAAPVTALEEEEDPEVAARREMNRREFLMYSWGAALGLLTLQAGVASFLFLYPRFREGEFGGNFIMSRADFADPSAPPNGEPTGKFWMVTTETGEPKAIYMVCTHLGCLYKWVGANHRFECPCHGSKFSHDGFYIEGPAPRSLDSFEITQQGDQVIVNTGRRILGGPAAESPARAVPA
jgi:cytochrome b6-f complex iron-sulfur subunit